MTQAVAAATALGPPTRIEPSVEDILTSPYVSIGTFDENAGPIGNVRKLTSMSYAEVFPTFRDAFAPVIPLLREERP